jgi:hypothetical protein
MRGACFLSLLGAAILAGSVAAQSVVVPNANWTASGTSGLNTLLRQTGNPRTYQIGIAAAELAGMPPGSLITGVSFRVWTGATSAWPATNATWTNYEITLAEAAVPLSSFSTTFAANMKNPVQVRQGSMTVPAGTYAVTTANPNPFDTFYFAFQKPYVYKGGDLVILYTHDGNLTNTTEFLGVVPSSAGTHGVAQYDTSYRSTTATIPNTDFVITRIHFGYGDARCVGSGGFPPLLILSHALQKPTPPPGKVNFAVTNAMGGEPGYVVVGLVRATIPLPNGCNLLVGPIVAWIPFWLKGSGPGQGRWDLNLAFPASVMGSFELQAAVLDSGATGGYVGTNGVSLILQP